MSCPCATLATYVCLEYALDWGLAGLKITCLYTLIDFTTNVNPITSRVKINQMVHSKTAIIALAMAMKLEKHQINCMLENRVKNLQRDSLTYL